jgi:hypothetical protein
MRAVVGRAAWVLALGAAGSGLGACGDGGAAGDGALPEWTVAATPLLDLGDDGDDAEPALGVVTGLTRLPDGGVLVADQGLFALRWFDANGTLTRSVGRQGKGPGEWTYIARMLRCGDSVYVFDIERGTGSLLPVAMDGGIGTLLNTVGPESAKPYRTVCNGDRRFLSYGWENLMALMTEGRTGRWRGQTPFWLNDRDSALALSLGEHPGSERLVMEGGSGPHPLGKETVIALSRRYAYVGSADSALVLRFALDGSPAEPLRLPPADLATTPDDIAAWKYRDTLGQSADDVAWSVRNLFSIEFPPTVPAYDALLVDADDRVYVRRTPRGWATDAEWLVFDPEGAPLARLRLPADLQVHEFGRGYALGVLVDEASGAQRVRLMAIDGR